MAKKKAKHASGTETRKHTAMIRIEEAAREKAAKAARMIGVSLADYASRVLSEQADRDVMREAKKIVSGEGK